MRIISILICGGLGAKMVSRVPTVLHRVAGKPLFLYPLEALRSLDGVDQIVVVGNEIESAREQISDYLPSDVDFVRQDQAESDMAAVSRILDTVTSDHVLVVEGDRPLLRAVSIRGLVQFHLHHSCNVSIAMTEKNCPRISDDGHVTREVTGIMFNEASAGIFMFNRTWLQEILSRAGKSDALSRRAETCISSLIPHDASCHVCVEQRECLKVISRVDLAAASSAMRMRKNSLLMKAGVLLEDPDHTYIDSQVSIGAGTVIGPGCSIEGDSRIGEGCIIGPHTIIRDSSLADRCLIETAVIESSSLGPGSRVSFGIHLKSNIRMNFSTGG